MQETEILINKIAQNILEFEHGKNILITDLDTNYFSIFEILENYIFNSIPDKSNYNSESYQEAIRTIPIKSSQTPVVILSKNSTKIAFKKLKELPKSEHEKVITTLLWVYKVTDTKRRESECKNGCCHFWHNLD